MPTYTQRTLREHLPDWDQIEALAVAYGGDDPSNPPDFSREGAGMVPVGAPALLPQHDPHLGAATQHLDEAAAVGFPTPEGQRAWVQGFQKKREEWSRLTQHRAGAIAMHDEILDAALAQATTTGALRELLAGVRNQRDLYRAELHKVVEERDDLTNERQQHIERIRRLRDELAEKGRTLNKVIDEREDLKVALAFYEDSEQAPLAAKSIERHLGDAQKSLAEASAAVERTRARRAWCEEGVVRVVDPLGPEVTTLLQGRDLPAATTQGAASSPNLSKE